MPIESRIPFWTMALLGTGLCALFGAVPAHAVDYVAELAANPSATQASIGAGELTWQCSGTRCIASGQTGRSRVDLCRRLAQRVGRIISFEIQVPPAFSRVRMPVAELAECNKGIGPQFKAPPDLRPRIPAPGTSSLTGSKIAKLPPPPGEVIHEVVVSQGPGVLQGSGTAHLSLSGGGGLTGFRFDFRNGDHKVKSIGLVQSAGAVTATFSDNDGNDPFRFVGRFRKLPEGIQIKSTGSDSCRAVCGLTVENDPNGVLVLAGFEVRYRSDDRNILEFAVDPQPESGRIRVVFKDNGAEEYSARVQYAFIPRSLVKEQRTLAGARKAGSGHVSRSDRELPRGKRFLQGFEFRYTNGDHHLKKLAVDDMGEEMALFFNDNDTDDPAYVSARYVVLN